MNYHRVTTLALLILATALAGCGKREKSVEGSTPSTGIPVASAAVASEVRVAYPPMVASLPFVIARDAHLLSANNVAVKDTLFTSSNDMLNSMVAGQSDLIPAISIVPIIQLEIQHPGRVRLYSHSQMTAAYAIDAILVKANSSIKSLAELEGKKIGLFPGTAPTNFMKAFLRRKGVAIDRITWVQLAPPAQIASLTAGAVDALFTYEPVTTTALAQPAFRKLHGSIYTDLLDPSPIGASVISREFERKHPDAARQVLKALDEATAEQNQHPEKYRAMVAAILKTPSEIADKVNIVPATLSSANDVASLQKFIDLLYEIGEIPEKIDANRLVSPTK